MGIGTSDGEYYDDAAGWAAAKNAFHMPGHPQKPYDLDEAFPPAPSESLDAVKNEIDQYNKWGPIVPQGGQGEGVLLGLQDALEEYKTQKGTARGKELETIIMNVYDIIKELPILKELDPAKAREPFERRADYNIKFDRDPESKLLTGATIVSS